MNGNAEEEKASRDIIEYLLSQTKISRKMVGRVKARFSKKYHLSGMIRNATILHFASEEEREILAPYLRRKSTRTLSGVSVVAVMTKPIECPGKCIYCPGPASQPDRPVAQSYTGREPAALRSLMYDYDSFLQVKSRIEDLEAIGHEADKIEIICMGGTLPAADLVYQTQFVKGCLDGVLGYRSESIAQAKKLAETAPRRLVGLTFETRPDYCRIPQINQMVDFGATRVEIGVQTVFDDVYERVCRGHTTQDSIKAIQHAKDAGLKVNLHIMPNLPGSSLKRDQEMFTHLFEDPTYRPDMLKIYPTLVIEGTQLYDMWQRNEYTPYSLEETVRLIGKAKANLPPYVRIQRIQRDIPAPLIKAGVDKSNLRQLVKNYMADVGLTCGCIRCREHGFLKQLKNPPNSVADIPIRRLEYQASEGTEYFLSIEQEEPPVLFGFARLRVPSPETFRPEIPAGISAILREIRVVGELVPKAEKPKVRQIQHRGMGTALLGEVEHLTFNELDREKLVVISGLGVRTWFYKRGYEADGPYVSKKRA